MEPNGDPWQGRKLVTSTSRSRPLGNLDEGNPGKSTEPSNNLSSAMASGSAIPQFGAGRPQVDTPITFASAVTPPRPAAASTTSTVGSSEKSPASTSKGSTLGLPSYSGLFSLGHRHSSSIQSLTPSEVSFTGSEDDIGRYDVTNEPLPKERFFDTDFQAALTHGIGIAQRAVNALQKDDWINKDQRDLHQIWSNAKKLAKYQGTDTRTIAVLGDSGEGKSSLINSLLHCPDIAKEADLGSACTSVVTEYHQKTADHTAPITIEIDRLSQVEIEAEVEELLWSYRQLYLLNLDAEDDAAEYKRCERESEVARSTLQAAFGDHEELEDLLETAKGETTDAVSAQLIEWTTALEWPERTLTAEDADECSEKTEGVMEDKFWPFTRLIRVYLDAHILRTGIVLADLPGLHDVNLARVRITEQYLLRCDHILLVTKISRAITDQSVKSSLYTVLRRHAPHEWEKNGAKNLNVTIVCTRSDDINTKAARKAFCGPRKRIGTAVMQQLDDQIKNAKDKKLKKKLQLKHDFLLIKARSEDVKERLRRAYTAKVEGGSLNVFCVSNKHYKKFSTKGNTEYVNASGVPELRNFCQSIAARAQYREARHLLDTSLPSLLSSMRLWVESFRERTESLHQELQEKLEAGAEAAISKVIDVPGNVEQEFIQDIHDQLLQIPQQRNDHFEDAAIKESEKWLAWRHWASYDAWCRNKGTHTTPAIGYVRWNSALIWKMRAELDYPWDMVEEDIPTSFEKMISAIRAALLEYKLVVDDVGGFPAFAEGIDSRIRDVEYLFPRLERIFSLDIKNTRQKASEDNHSSYILDLMLPSYRSAASQSGTGKSARQKHIVHGRVTDGTLFPAMAQRMKASLEGSVEATFQYIREQLLQNIINRIRADLRTTIAQQRERGTPLDKLRETIEVELHTFEEELEELHNDIGPSKSEANELSDPSRGSEADSQESE